MSQDILQERSDLIANPSRQQILNAQSDLGMFAADTYNASDFAYQGSAAPFIQNMIDTMPQYLQQIDDNFAAAAERQKQANIAYANKKKEEQLKEIRDNVQYRKAELLRNPDGSLKQDSDLELGVKKGLNWLADKWNKVNDYVPFVDDKTLDINGRMTGTVAGMQNENLENKNLGLFGGHKDTKAESLKEINSLKDDPNGNGTLYYLRRNIGTEANPEYIYKLGFAALDAADRYRSQVGALGWDIVKEVQSSGAAEAEKNAHAAFQGDRLLSYDQVMKDGKWQSRDDASGIHFGSGYGEIYKKDILGWDKKPTQADVEKYKQQVIQNAIASGKSGTDLSALVKNMSKFGVNDLDNLIKQQNGENSYNKMIEDKVYHTDHYKDDAWTAIKTNLDKGLREMPDALLDAAVGGLDNTSMLGRVLEADGKGNSALLDEWKSDETVNKYHNYDYRSQSKANNQFLYDIKNGNYLDAMTDAFMGGNINTTVGSLAYFVPSLIPVAGQAGKAAQATSFIGKLFSKIGTKLGMLKEVEGATDLASLAKAEQLKKDIARISSPIGERFAGIQNAVSKAGFYGQAAAMTNERIDERIKNNGGKPTSMLENLSVFAETVIENSLDRFIDMSTIKIGEHNFVKDSFQFLDDISKGNVAAKLAGNTLSVASKYGVEAATEWLQQWGQTFSEQYNTKKNGGTIEGILNSNENREEALQSFIMGGIMGAHVHVAGMAKDAAFGAGTKLWNKAKGNEARGIREQARKDISDNILAGTFDPYSNVISHSGKTADDSINDMHDVISNDGRIGHAIASSALGVVDKSTEDLIANVSKSIKNTYGLDDSPLDKQDQQSVNLYNHLMSSVAEQAVSNIISTAEKIAQNHKSTMSEEDARKLMAELQVDPNTPVQDFIHHYAEAGSEKVLVDGLKNLTQSLEKHLDTSTYSSVVLSIGNSLIEKLRRGSQIESLTSDGKAGKILDKAANADQIFNLDKNGKVTLNLAEVHTAFSSLKALEASLSAAATKAHSGGMRMGSMPIDEAAKMLAGQTKQLEAIMQRGEKEGNKVQVDPTFFDSLKDSSEVGTEILYRGKSGAGEHYGSGIYEHEQKIKSEIKKLYSADPVKHKDIDASSQLLNNVEQFWKFAIDRVRPNIHIAENGKIDPNLFLTGAERRGNKENAFNYFPQEDPNGFTAKEKIKEAGYIIGVANSILAALPTENSSHTRMTTADIKDVKERMEEIIKQSKEDIQYLEAHVKGLGEGISKYAHATNIKYYERPVDENGDKGLVEQKEKAVKGTNIYEHEGKTYKMSNITKTLARLDKELEALETLGAVERHKATPYEGEKLDSAVDIYNSKSEPMDHTGDFTVVQGSEIEYSNAAAEKFIIDNLLGKSIYVGNKVTYKFTEKDGELQLLKNNEPAQIGAGIVHTAISAYAQSKINSRKEYVQKEQIARYSNEKFVHLDRAESNVFGFTTWNDNSGSKVKVRAADVVGEKDASFKDHPEPQSQDSAETSDNNTTSTGEEVNVEDKSEQGSDSRSDETPREGAEENQDTKSDQQRAGTTARHSEAPEVNKELTRNADGKLIYKDSGKFAPLSELEQDKSDVVIAAEAELDELYNQEQALIQDILDYLGVEDFSEIKGKGLKNRLAFIKKAITSKSKSNIDTAKSLDKLDKLANLQEAVKFEKERAKYLKSRADDVSKNSSKAEAINSRQKVINALRDKLLKDFLIVGEVEGKKAYKLRGDLSIEDQIKATGYLNRLNKLLTGTESNVFTAPKRPKKPKAEIPVGGSEDVQYSADPWAEANKNGKTDHGANEYYEQYGEDYVPDLSILFPSMHENSGSDETKQEQEVNIEENQEDKVEEADILESHDEDQVKSDDKESEDLAKARNLFSEISEVRKEYEKKVAEREALMEEANKFLQSENNAKFLKAYKDAAEDSSIRKNFKIVKQGEEEFIQGTSREGKEALKKNLGTISQLMQLCK